MPAGRDLLLLTLLVSLLVHSGRSIFGDEGRPAFFLAPAPQNLLLLEGDFARGGLHQYSDGEGYSSVIIMAAAPGTMVHLEQGADWSRPQPGQVLSGRRVDEKNIAVSVGWMPARQRIALGIPLHPDRMSRADWEALPGIGPKLALAVELDRQENGDFGTLEALDRVRGIGPKRIEAWRKFF